MVKLPREVLHQIFTLKNIDDKTLLQLQLTCKEWAQVAKMIFYKSVSVHCNSQRASSLKRALQLPGNSAAQHITHFGFRASAFSNDTSLSSILSYCPNLRSIEEQPMYGETSRYNYYPELLALRQQGHVRYLEQVDAPPFNANAKVANADYIQLMLALKTSITKLHLCNYSSDQPSVFALTPHLAAFSRLKQIEIVSEAGITIQQLSAILDSKHSYQEILVDSLRFVRQQDQQSTEGDPCAGLSTLSQVKVAYLAAQSFSIADI